MKKLWSCVLVASALSIYLGISVHEDRDFWIRYGLLAAIPSMLIIAALLVTQRLRKKEEPREKKTSASDDASAGGGKPHNSR